MQDRNKILENLALVDLLPNCLRFLDQRKARGESAKGLALIGTDSRDLIVRVFRENKDFERYPIVFRDSLEEEKGADGWYRVDIDHYCKMYGEAKHYPPLEDLKKIRY